VKEEMSTRFDDNFKAHKSHKKTAISIHMSRRGFMHTQNTANVNTIPLKGKQKHLAILYKQYLSMVNFCHFQTVRKIFIG